MHFYFLKKTTGSPKATHKFLKHPEILSILKYRSAYFLQGNAKFNDDLRLGKGSKKRSSEKRAEASSCDSASGPLKKYGVCGGLE